MKVLTNNNYYEVDEYMSTSLFKRFRHCELAGLQPHIEMEKSKALMIGSYVDAFIEGTLDQFKEENPSVFLKTGANKGSLKADFIQADEICEYITNNEVLMQFLSGEKQTIMSGFIEGVPYKIKMDSYSPGIAINDLKVMQTVTDKNGLYYDFITPWGYDLQLAAYQEIVRQNTGKRLLCYICAVTKENPINSVIVNIPQIYLDKALYEIQSNIVRYYDIKMCKVAPIGCGICGACIKARKGTDIISMMDLINN